jgi:hypothetical protein
MQETGLGYKYPKKYSTMKTHEFGCRLRHGSTREGGESRTKGPRPKAQHDKKLEAEIRTEVPSSALSGMLGLDIVPRANNNNIALFPDSSELCHGCLLSLSPL